LRAASAWQSIFIYCGLPRYARNDGRRKIRKIGVIRKIRDSDKKEIKKGRIQYAHTFCDFISFFWGLQYCKYTEKLFEMIVKKQKNKCYICGK